MESDGNKLFEDKIKSSPAIFRFSCIPFLNSFDVKLVIYDAIGRQVAILVNEKLSPGSYEIDFDGSNFSSGVYFYKLETEGFIETKRMILLK
ncbi:MAG: T9SS type A sorting domain-containing protein [Bacteroidota bacterium]|nr:T9SS type A sorting domain-containing protein [Bacteroidota bacterium]